jgi:hypothetical protein
VHFSPNVKEKLRNSKLKQLFLYNLRGKTLYQKIIFFQPTSSIDKKFFLCILDRGGKKVVE